LTGDVTGTGPGATATTITNAVKSVAAVGSAPAAAGASIATTVLTLQPADATHPGVVSAAAQTFGGAKTIGGCLLNATLAFSEPGVGFGTNGFIGGSSATTIGNVAVGTHIDMWLNGSTRASVHETNLDMTGFGAGGALKLKSPDGTIYTLTVANGGTLNIA
jgi:hypothetical protein